MEGQRAAGPGGRGPGDRRRLNDIAEEVRREVVSLLFPGPTGQVGVEVCDGVVTLTGHVRDTSFVPVAARLVRAVEGVVDVDCRLTGGAGPLGQV
nr:hypothetical protein StreXyl84_12200 [Streptomyces sp. Xyl84]